ncbi:MAG: hypothetical protein E6H10_13125 [Bacteroidetes bacterium]|nr:MAG: hypothetical protein E6H10_13125 [Bacteroidota bacterium]
MSAVHRHFKTFHPFSRLLTQDRVLNLQCPRPFGT